MATQGKAKEMDSMDWCLGIMCTIGHRVVEEKEEMKIRINNFVRILERHKAWAVFGMACPGFVDKAVRAVHLSRAESHI